MTVTGQTDGEELLCEVTVTDGIRSVRSVRLKKDVTFVVLTGNLVM